MIRPRGVLAFTLVLCLLCGHAYGFSTEKLNFDFYVGWQGGQRQTLTASSDGTIPGALFRSVKLEIPNRGLWLGGGVSTASCGNYNVYLQGWYFFPNNVRGSILLDPGGATGLTPADVTSHLDWWYVDIFGTRRFSGPFSGVLGIRFDHHDYYTDDPSILNMFIPVANRMRLDLNMLCTIPYFGFQWGPDYGLTLRLVYSPCGWMDAKSTLSQNNDTVRPLNWLGGKAGLNGREFLELFGEYVKETSCSTQIGVFGRGTWLSGNSHTSLSETIQDASSEYDVAYRRVSWTVGGKATIRFETQQLWSW